MSLPDPWDDDGTDERNDILGIFAEAARRRDAERVYRAYVDPCPVSMWWGVLFVVGMAAVIVAGIVLLLVAAGAAGAFD